MRAEGYVTMLDPFQLKFGRRMGALLFLPALLGDIFWSAAILSALGSTLTVIVGLNDILSIVLSACIAIVYTMFGGLYSVAYTDVIQLICIFVGLWICVPFALTHEKVIPISSSKAQWLGTLTGRYAGVYIDTYMVLLLGGIPWQEFFQRVLAAKTTRNAQMLSYVGTVGCAVMAIPSILIGAVARSADWTNTTIGHSPGTNGSDHEFRMVLPLVLQNFTPTAVAFIGLGAVSAAVMSSADSAILAAGTLFARNIYKFLIREKATEREILIVMKLTVVAVGAMATGLAICIRSVYGLWFLCSDLVYVILFPQLVLVLYYRNANTYGSLAGYVIGMLLRLLGGEPIIGLPPIIPYFNLLDNDDTQLFPFRTFAMLVSLATIVATSELTRHLFITKELLDLRWDVFHCFHKDDDPPVKVATIHFRKPEVPLPVNGESMFTKKRRRPSLSKRGSDAGENFSEKGVAGVYNAAFDVSETTL
ncbi:high-affinity choline transporter 1-like isoform X2 [Paramacrobiotus metropolitanus]|nr:high-affinity choline transporter 1-like isoform X2 [Paramacrobiotus metropolitanus]